MTLALVDNVCATLQLAANDTAVSPERWPINKPLIIGRENADIQFNIHTLSRQHAEIKPVSSNYLIRDLNSRNGTAVNGHFLTEDPVALKSGDSILLAGKVEFSFLIPLATPSVPRLGATKGLWIDPISEAVWINAHRIDPPLSRKQFTLLTLIAAADGKPVSREEIALAIWPNASPGHISHDAIDSLIKRLRKKLKPLEGKKLILEMVRGRGIRLIK